MSKAVIFDLDSCLSAAAEPGQQLFAPAFEAMARANQGTHLTGPCSRMRVRISSSCWVSRGWGGGRDWVWCIPRVAWFLCQAGDWYEVPQMRMLGSPRRPSWS